MDLCEVSHTLLYENNFKRGRRLVNCGIQYLEKGAPRQRNLSTLATTQYVVPGMPSVQLGNLGL